jgi:hypothetical protein
MRSNRSDVLRESPPFVTELIFSDMKPSITGLCQNKPEKNGENLSISDKNPQLFDSPAFPMS